MKKNKLLIVIVLAIVMFVSLMPISTIAAVTGPTITIGSVYNVSVDDEITVSVTTSGFGDAVWTDICFKPIYDDTILQYDGFELGSYFDGYRVGYYGDEFDIENVDIYVVNDYEDIVGYSWISTSSSVHVSTCNDNGEIIKLKFTVLKDFDDSAEISLSFRDPNLCFTDDNINFVLDDAGDPVCVDLVNGEISCSGEDETTTITVGDITEQVLPGATIAIPVTISNNAGFADFTGSVVYDSDALTPASPFITKGSAIPSHMSLVANAGISLNTLEGNVQDNGEILVLHFIVNSNVNVSNTEISIMRQNNSANNFTDIEGVPVDVNFVSGSVSIKLTGAAKIGNKEYQTMEKALNEITDNQTLVLLKDYEGKLEITKSITLDLNGKTISNTGDCALRIGGTSISKALTVNVTSSVAGGKITSNYSSNVSGTVYVMYSQDYTNGVFVTVNFNSDNVTVENTATTNGKLIYCQDSTYCCTFIHITAGRYITNSVCQALVNVYANGGTYSFNPAYFASSYSNADNEYVTKNTDNTYTITTKDMFSVNGVNYKFFDLAIAQANSGDTIKLLENYHNLIYIPKTKNIKFDLNGKNILLYADVSDDSYFSGRMIKEIFHVDGQIELVNSSSTLSSIKMNVRTSNAVKNCVVNTSMISGSKFTVNTNNVCFEVEKGNCTGGSIFFYSYNDNNVRNIIINGGIYLNDDPTNKLGYVSTNWKGKVVVNGGTFNIDPRDSEYAIIGDCHVTKDLATEYYEVSAHNWGDGVVTTPIGANGENGVRTFTCSCGAEKTEEIVPIVSLDRFGTSWGYYETLDEAVSYNSAWRAGVIATVLCDLDEAVITFGKLDGLDLNGHTINTLKLIGNPSTVHTSGSVDLGAQYGDYVHNGKINNLIIDGTATLEGTYNTTSISLGADLEIGTITCTGVAWIHTAETFNSTINEINYTGTSNPSITGNPIINTFKYSGTSTSGLTIEGGTIKDFQVASGSVYRVMGPCSLNIDPTGHISNIMVTGYHLEVEQSGTMYNVIKVAYPVFIVNDVYYGEFTSAYEAAGEGGIIKLGDSYNKHSISGSYNYTLDLNGHDLNTSISVYKNIKIINTSSTLANISPSSSSSSYLFSMNKGTVTIDSENIKINNSATCAIGYSWYSLYAGIITIDNAIVVTNNYNYGSVKNIYILNGGSYVLDPTSYVDLDNCHIKQDLDTNYYVVSKHNIVIDEYIPATTMADGKTEGKYCSICGKVWSTQQVIPKLQSEKADEEKIEIDVSDEDTEATSGIPTEVFDQKTQTEENKSVAIEVGNLATIIFNGDAAKAISTNAGTGNVVLTVQKHTAEEKQEDIAQAGIVGAKQVFSFTLTVDNQNVFGENNAEGTANVAIPYTPADPDAIILVYYINGVDKTLVPASFVDGVLTVTLNHFSDYVIAEHTTHTYEDHICTECGGVDEHLKFYFRVTSGNTVDLVVDDTYTAIVRLPEDGTVNTLSVIIEAIMQNVATLDVTNIKRHQINVTTNLGDLDVNLKTWLDNAYGFTGATVNVTIDGNDLTYEIAATDDNNRIVATTDTQEARTAWQALTSHVETSTQTEDDSFVEIVNGSYIKIGTEYLRFDSSFEGNLVLDNFSDLEGLGSAIREAVYLDTCTDQKGVITLFVKAGTKLAVGQTVATLQDDYMLQITIDEDYMSPLTGILASLRDTSGAKNMVKKLVEKFNDVIGVVDECGTISVVGHVHVFDQQVIDDKYLVSEATCEDKAVYYYSCICGDCGTETFEYGDPLNHDYEYTYTWDGDSCTATRVCKNDENHTDTETVTGEYVKDTDAKCEVNEKGHYEATFTATYFEAQETAANSVELAGTATDHDYEYTYTWDGKSCTATRTCKNDASHTNTQLGTVVYVKDTDATCTTNEFGHYEATFSITYFTKQITAANSVEKSNSALSHDYGTVTYTWNADNTVCTASRTCKRDGCGHEEKENATVTHEVTQNKTCTLDELTKYTATFTNTAFTTQVKANVKTANKLGHDYGEVSYDWDDDECTASRTCSRNGCGHVDTETVEGKYVKDTDAKCEVNEKGHLKATFTSTAFAEQNTAANSVEVPDTALVHTYGVPSYEWDDDECTASRTCTRTGCGHVDSETVEGKYVKDSDAKCEVNEKGHLQAKFEGVTFLTQNTAANSVEKTGSALDHDYKFTYNWTGNSCKATRVCSHDSTDKVTETVTGVYVKDTDATCTTNEFGHLKATFENTIFAEQNTPANSVEKTGSALNHNYEYTYTWNGKSCTATRVCKNDQSHKTTETKTGVYVKDTDATCTENEKGHYEVTFSSSIFAKQVTDANSVVVADTALSHDYGAVTYTWNADNTVCTASRTCKRDGCGHEESENATITPEVTQNKTCTLDELTKYTATFTNTAFATQVKENVKTADKLNHNYGEISYVWAQDNSTCTATRTCNNDSTHIETETVNTVKTVTQNKSATLDEISKYTATFTNKIFATQVKENVKTADKLGYTKIDKPAQDTTTYTYTGSEITYVVAANANYTVNGNKQIKAGTYKVTITLKDKTTYAWTDNTQTDIEYTFVINKATYDMSGVVFEDKTVISDGEKYSIYATNLPEGVMVTYEGNRVSESGTHTVTAKFVGSSNYNDIPDMTATLTILVKPENKEVITDDEGKVEGNLPTGVNAEITELVESTIPEKIAAVQAVVAQQQIEESKVITVYDVTLTAGTEKVQPNGSIKITINIADELKKVGFDIYHVHTDENGVKTSTKLDYTRSNSEVSFEVDSLSQFVFVENGQTVNTIEKYVLIAGIVLGVLTVAILLVTFFIIKARKNPLKK